MTQSITIARRSGNYGPEVDNIDDTIQTDATVGPIVATHTSEVDVPFPGAAIGDIPGAEFAAFDTQDPPVAVVVPDGLCIVGARVKAADTVSITFLATIALGAPATFSVFVYLVRTTSAGPGAD
jgi:hypothetical protein